MTTDCLGVVLELNGILAAVPLAYILPALCYLKLEEGPLLSSKKLPALGLFIAGVFVALSGLFLILFNDNADRSCKHGLDMEYCNITVSNPTTISSIYYPKTQTNSTILKNFIMSTISPQSSPANLKV